VHPRLGFLGLTLLTLDALVLLEPLTRVLLPVPPALQLALLPAAQSLMDEVLSPSMPSGDEDEAYSYWIRGNALTPRAPRWSILRNVFGWK